MYSKVAFLFWSTLVLYILTLLTVSYVGVYLTYVTIPIIIISGLALKFMKPTSVIQEDNEQSIHPDKIELITQKNEKIFLIDYVNNKLDYQNKVNNLFYKRSLDISVKISLLKEEQDNLKDTLFRCSNNKEQAEIENKLNTIINEIVVFEDKITTIKKACEYEVDNQRH